MPASLKISALAAAAALTAALASCSTGGVSPASSSSVSLSHKPLSALKQQARREHGLVIYGNVPPQYFQAVFAAFHKQRRTRSFPLRLMDTVPGGRGRPNLSTPEVSSSGKIPK